MRHMVLPLPTGRFIIVQASASGELALLNGAPLAFRRPVDDALSGMYGWRGREYPATLYTSYRDAFTAAQSLDGARPLTPPTLTEELTRN